MDGDACNALDVHIQELKGTIGRVNRDAETALRGDAIATGDLAFAVASTAPLVASKEVFDKLYDEATRIAERVLDTGNRFREVRLYKSELERLELVYNRTCGAKPLGGTL